MKTTNLRREDRVSVESLSFWNLLKLIHLSNFLKLSFFVSILIAVTVRIIANWQPTDILQDFAKYLGNTGAQISGTILGIVIAGLAILTALSNGGLMNLLLKNRLLQRLLIPFWFVSVLWAITLGGGMVLYAITMLIPITILEWAVTALAFMFCYSLCLTISLVGATIQIGILAAEFIDEDER